MYVIIQSKWDLGKFIWWGSFLICMGRFEMITGVSHGTKKKKAYLFKIDFFLFPHLPLKRRSSTSIKKGLFGVNLFLVWNSPFEKRKRLSWFLPLPLELWIHNVRNLQRNGKKKWHWSLEQATWKENNAWKCGDKVWVVHIWKKEWSMLG